MKNAILPTIRCSEKLREDLEQLAAQQGRTLSNLILFVLKAEIDKK